MKTIKYEVIRYRYVSLILLYDTCVKKLYRKRQLFSTRQYLSRQERNKIGVYLFNTGVGYCANGLCVPVWVP